MKLNKRHLRRLRTARLRIANHHFEHSTYHNGFYIYKSRSPTPSYTLMISGRRNIPVPIAIYPLLSQALKWIREFHKAVPSFSLLPINEKIQSIERYNHTRSFTIDGR